MQLRYHLRRLRKDQRGSIAVITALGMVVIMGMAALVLDVGSLYLERARITRAADAAALAGSQSLVGTPKPADAFLEAAVYGWNNGLDLSKTQIRVDEVNRKVKVESTKGVTFGLARLIGVDKGDVQGPSEAQVGAVTGVRYAVPLGVEKQNFVYGQTYILKEGGGSGYNGNYGALALGLGASDYRTNLQYGYDGWLRVNQWVPTETGNMSGPTWVAMKSRFDRTDPKWSFDNATQDCPLLLIVPVINTFTVNGRGEVQVVGFAAMYVDKYIGNGSDSQIYARFKEMIIEGEFSPVQTDYGLRSSKLTR
ncbi:MAG: pilus assembly protein TadG-related protein [Bacillota bacterium]